MTVNNTINDFKLFAQIWNKVENIYKKQTKGVEVTENQSNSNFRYFLNEYDSSCNCYLYKDLGNFKLRNNQKGGDSSK